MLWTGVGGKDIKFEIGYQGPTTISAMKVLSVENTTKKYILSL